jgi:hypothetical protein
LRGHTTHTLPRHGQEEVNRARRQIKKARSHAREAWPRRGKQSKEADGEGTQLTDYAGKAKKR